MIDYLIVGAGLTGATLAQQLHAAGKTVRVIDKRAHIGGNCYTTTRAGIIMSLYGGHVFHTNSARIWKYVNRFTDWQQYEHRVKAHYRGNVYSFPPNLMTYQQIGIKFGPGTEHAMRHMFFEGYTEKQWGRSIADVPESVLARIPMRGDWDDRYFSDRWQGLPEGGYTPMIAAMLEGVDVDLETPYSLDKNYNARTVIYTGPIDALLGYSLGRLEYRSLRFEHALISEYNQGCATMNYTEADVPYTRIMQWSYWWRNAKHIGLITTEYPAEYTGNNEPYYPIETEYNREMYAAYARMLPGNLVPAGRLGTYRYLNMDQAIGGALALAERLLK